MTSRPGYYEEAQVPDMQRRMSDMIVIGVVEEQDYKDPKAPRVRVRVGKELTGWLPWSSGSAGGNTDWEPLDKGEQVIMASPSGDRSQAVILGTIHKEDAEAPDKDPDVTARKWKDGTQQSYNRKNHAWLLKLNDGGNFKVQAGDTTYELKNGSVDIKTKTVTVSASDGMTFTTPKLTVSGDVVAGGVSLIEHLHTKVMPGPMVSGPPLGGSLNTGGIDGGGGNGGSSGGGGAGGGDSDGNTPSSPGNPETAGTYGNGIANDATGVYRAAVQSRVPYQGTPNIAGSGLQQGRFAYTFANMPARPSQIDAETFYDRVRQSGVGFFDGYVYQSVVSEFDQETETWTDDVIDVFKGSESFKVGTYLGEIPGGIQAFDQPGPFDVFLSREGVHYAKYCDWMYVARIDFGVTTGERPIFWKLTPEEVAEHVVPVEDN